MTLSITFLGYEISINRSVTVAEWLSSYFPLLLLGCHQCLVAVSSPVRAPPPTNLLWELVHLPPRFPIFLAVGWHLVICALVPTPQCSQKGVSHPCPSICIAWPGLRVVVSVFYCIRSLVQMFLNLILHHKCRHQQVPKYDCTVYIVFVCVLVSI